ncbi:thrombopoietin receptor isoform X2 [Brachyhypopomus gauderio]|uniref:thrombopoietin receptor isoform X2 n=1 Tax=Brachyhypopomus gauderio TaxID=698409 RepID=UPI004041A422
MDANLTWSILLFYLIVQMNCDPLLSKQDQALLSAEEDPKCFTKTLDDFTCFWEAPLGTSYNFIYRIDNEETTCNISQQNSEEGKVLHVCSFLPSDVFLFTNIHVKVMDTHTNATIYKRTVSIEEHVLLYPPSNISLHLIEKVGKMQVRWQNQEEPKELSNKMEYEICYSYRNSQAMFTQVIKHYCSPTCEYELPSLDPGESCIVKMRVRPDNSTSFRGQWSSWSPAVEARVPQSANSIELQCHTHDLHQIQCKWNKELYSDANYTLHYRQSNSTWESCGKHSDAATHCIFYGEESTTFHVYLRSGLGPLGRTFYMDKICMNNIIRTEAPRRLQESVEKGRLCLKWSCPLPLISQHLKYNVRYQLQGENEWKSLTIMSAKICLDVQMGSHYTIQVQAMPNGTFYKGHWSHWSKPLMVQLPSNTGFLFIVCGPLSLLILSVSILLYPSFTRYVSKLKQFLWPPVPNLNEVLENFLKDINEQNWEPKFSIKMCDDTPASVVEIMSESGSQLMRNPSMASTCPLFLPQGSLTADSGGEYSQGGLEVSREYVTLDTSVLPCLTGNDYVCSGHAPPGLVGERLCCCSSICSTTFSASSTSILNHSYLQAEFGECNFPAFHYTNLDNTETARVK